MIKNYLSKEQKRTGYTILFVAIVLLAAFALANKLLYSSAKLVIEGVHNPTTTSVYVKDKKLFPGGKDGRTYTFRGRTGTYTASIKGPGIKPVDVSLNVQRFTVTNASAKTTAMTFRETAADTIKPGAGEAITSVLAYGNADWLVAQVENKSAGTDRKLFVLHYDENIRAWKVAVSGIKIDLNYILANKPPQQLLDYLSEEGGD